MLANLGVVGFGDPLEQVCFLPSAAKKALFVHNYLHVSFSAEILALTCTPIMLLPWGWEPFIAAIPVLLADGWLLGNPCCLVAAYHGWGRSLFTIVQSSW